MSRSRTNKAAAVRLPKHQPSRWRCCQLAIWPFLRAAQATCRVVWRSGVRTMSTTRLGASAEDMLGCTQPCDALHATCGGKSQQRVSEITKHLDEVHKGKYVMKWAWQDKPKCKAVWEQPANWNVMKLWVGIHTCLQMYIWTCVWGKNVANVNKFSEAKKNSLDRWVVFVCVD